MSEPFSILDIKIKLGVDIYKHHQFLVIPEHLLTETIRIIEDNYPAMFLIQDITPNK